MNLIFILIIYFYIQISCIYAKKAVANLTDVRKCKFSRDGFDYKGPMARTESGLRCEYWAASNPLHQFNPEISDDDFPEGSRKQAKNYCRNPKHTRKTPWCYTMSKDVTDEVCEIPMCIFPDCRVTGPGLEYAGRIDKAATEIECVKWDKKHSDPENQKPFKFNHELFPEGSRKKAKNFCRNPDADPGGPWCYVEIDEDMLTGVLKNTAKVKNEKGEKEKEREFKEYCHPLFCKELVCAWFGGDSLTGPAASQFTWIPAEKVSELIFAVKLWDASGWPEAAVRLVLSPWSLVDPSGSVSLLISNRQSGLEFGARENEMSPSPDLIPERVDEWTWFNLRWFQGSLALYQGQDTSKPPLFLAEYPKGKGTVHNLSPGPFNFYAVQTNGLFWSNEICLQDCEMHVTSRSKWTHWHPIRKSEASWDIAFHVRAQREAALQLRPTPIHPFPHIMIVLQDLNNMTLIQYKHTETDHYKTLGSIRDDELLSEFQWREFIISVFGEKMDISVTKEGGMQPLLRATDYVFRRSRWFALASKNTLAYWTLFCKPTEEQGLPEPYEPDCVASRGGSHSNFAGKLSQSANGLPCLPWLSSRLAEAFHPDKLYTVDGSRVNARNYCRNLDNSPTSPWCFVEEITMQSQPVTIIKQECRPQLCQASECMNAGTGNDYIGTLSVTRSQRTCQKWSSNDTHEIPSNHKQPTRFPEGSVEKAENYCRNPTRNIAGLWCVTTDPTVFSDLCDVPDCDKPAESTVIVLGSDGNRFTYVTPDWRERGFRFWLKAWNPRLLDGITLELFPFDHQRGDTRAYRLDIGADGNERIRLYWIAAGKEKLLKKKTLPHLIPIGKWAGFWLRPRPGHIEFGLAGLKEPLFEWKDTDDQLGFTFKPAYINYRPYKGGALGVHFPPRDCHTERINTHEALVFYPIGLWKDKSSDGPFYNITFKFRGNSDVKIPILSFPGTKFFYLVQINEANVFINLLINYGANSTTVAASKLPNLIITKDRWTEVGISFTEKTLTVDVDAETVLKYNSPDPILVYLFSVLSVKKEVTWTANCDPLDIDGPPRDGGWSSWGRWECSATCGGGTGIQTRTCTKPRPNMLGEPCRGTDAFVGQCNMFQCGHLSPDTVTLIKHRLQTSHFSIIVDENEPVEIKCDQELVEIVKRESPEAKIEWTLNGAVVKEDDKRFETNNPEMLTSSSALPWHGGVYVCLLHRVIGRRAALRVITLAVRPNKPTHIKRKHTWLRFTCDASVLGFLYRDLTLRWEHDGLMAVDYGTTTPSAVDELKITEVTKEHKGEWRCLVRQPDLGFTWTTAIHLVEVLPAATFYTHLMEDKISAWLFGTMRSEEGAKALFITIIVIISILVIVYIFIHRFVFEKRRRRILKNMGRKMKKSKL